MKRVSLDDVLKVIVDSVNEKHRPIDPLIATRLKELIGKPVREQIHPLKEITDECAKFGLASDGMQFALSLCLFSASQQQLSQTLKTAIGVPPSALPQ